MIAPWMLYTVVVGACAAAAALAVEPLVVARGGARRGVWLAALVVAFLGPVAVAIRPVALPGALPTAVGASRVASGDVTPILVPAGADWERWPVVLHARVGTR